MIAFFPSPCPDELFYSMVARYQQRLSFLRPTDVVETLFDSPFIVVSYGFPYFLKRFYANLPKGSVLTPEIIIRNHSLFPFHRPFLAENKGKKIVAKMLGDEDVKGIHHAVAAYSDKIHMPQFMKYCQSCVNVDREHFGEAYWHRNHQLPGIRICYKHKVPLIESRVPTLFRDFHTPVSALEDIATNETKLFETKYESELDEYMVLSAQWLLESEVPVLGIDELRNRYLALLKSNNYTNSSGQVRQRELHRDFIGHYGDWFLRRVGCYPDEITGNWSVRRLFCSTQDVHPLQHLLLMKFFDTPPTTFFHDDFWNDRSLFLTAPQCGRIEIEDVRPQKITSKNTMIIPQEYVGNKRLLELIKDPTISYEEMLNQSGLTPFRLTNKLLGLCLGKYERIALRVKEAIVRMKYAYRKAIVKAIKMHPVPTRSNIYRVAMKEYRWLNRNDNEWLSNILPHPAALSKGRVDWGKRDEDYHLKARAAIEELVKEEKPLRITLATIECWIPGKINLQRNIDKLPKTRELLEQFGAIK